MNNYTIKKIISFLDIFIKKKIFQKRKRAIQEAYNTGYEQGRFDFEMDALLARQKRIKES